MNRYKDVIDILGFVPLEGEGGLWVKTCCSEQILPGGAMADYPDDRPLYGAIYYLLTPDTYSRMHRLTSNEIWFHHSGPAVRLLLIHPDGTSEVRLLGQDLRRGERPQILVPGGTWQGASMDPASCERFREALSYDDGPEDEEIYTLMSTSMAPEYLDKDFKAGTYEELKQYTDDEHLGLLELLTTDPEDL